MIDYKNKKILLLGPAPYVVNKKYDPKKYDIVCKVNHTYRLPISGFETFDVLYTSVYTDRKLGDYNWDWDNINADYLKLVYPAHLSFQRSIQARFESQNVSIPWENVDTGLYKELEKEILTRPNTGTIAIYDILKSDFKSLHISGITMFAGKQSHHDVYRQKKLDYETIKTFPSHNIKNQAKFLYPLLLKPNIYLDDEVHKGFQSAINS